MIDKLLLSSKTIRNIGLQYTSFTETHLQVSLSCKRYN